MRGRMPEGQEGGPDKESTVLTLTTNEGIQATAPNQKSPSAPDPTPSKA
jgi:hypothetical protein